MERDKEFLILTYAKEKYASAVYTLAITDDSIQNRLTGAIMYLKSLDRSDDLPEELQQEHANILAANTPTLTSEQGVDLAKRIMRIYTELRGWITDGSRTD
jgi:hypothetical protein